MMAVFFLVVHQKTHGWQKGPCSEKGDSSGSGEKGSGEKSSGEKGSGEKGSGETGNSSSSGEKGSGSGKECQKEPTAHICRCRAGAR